MTNFLFDDFNRLGALAAVAIFALFAASRIMHNAGYAGCAVFFAILGGVILVNVLVALADPTYGRGYFFTYLIATGAIVACASYSLWPGIILGIVLVAACFAATWATYRFRRRRASVRTVGH